MQPAGWGFCVVKVGKNQTALEGGEKVAEAWGPVIVDPNSPLFIGAECGSNNTGELSAIGEALLWAQTQVIASTTCIEIASDSLYAIGAVSGTLNGECNKDLYMGARSTLAEIVKSNRVVFTHVDGHSDHRWNDFADSLAKKGETGSFGKIGRWANYTAPAKAGPRSATSKGSGKITAWKAPPVLSDRITAVAEGETESFCTERLGLWCDWADGDEIECSGAPLSCPHCTPAQAPRLCQAHARAHEREDHLHLFCGHRAIASAHGGGIRTCPSCDATFCSLHLTTHECPHAAPGPKPAEGREAGNGLRHDGAGGGGNSPGARAVAKFLEDTANEVQAAKEARTTSAKAAKANTPPPPKETVKAASHVEVGPATVDSPGFATSRPGPESDIIPEPTSKCRHCHLFYGPTFMAAHVSKFHESVDTSSESEEESEAGGGLGSTADTGKESSTAGSPLPASLTSGGRTRMATHTSPTSAQAERLCMEPPPTLEPPRPTANPEPGRSATKEPRSVPPQAIPPIAAPTRGRGRPPKHVLATPPSTPAPRAHAADPTANPRRCAMEIDDKVCEEATVHCRICDLSYCPPHAASAEHFCPTTTDFTVPPTPAATRAIRAASAQAALRLKPPSNKDKVSSATRATGKISRPAKRKGQDRRGATPMPFHYNPMAVCSVVSGDIHCGPITRCRFCPRYLCSGHMEEHLRNRHLVDGNGVPLPHNGHGDGEGGGGGRPSGGGGGGSGGGRSSGGGGSGGEKGGNDGGRGDSAPGDPSRRTSSGGGGGGGGGGGRSSGGRGGNGPGDSSKSASSGGDGGGSGDGGIGGASHGDSGDKASGGSSGRNAYIGVKTPLSLSRRKPSDGSVVHTSGATTAGTSDTLRRREKGHQVGVDVTFPPYKDRDRGGAPPTPEGDGNSAGDEREIQTPPKRPDKRKPPGVDPRESQDGEGSSLTNLFPEAWSEVSPRRPNIHTNPLAPTPLPQPTAFLNKKWASLGRVNPAHGQEIVNEAALDKSDPAKKTGDAPRRRPDSETLEVTTSPNCHAVARRRPTSLVRLEDPPEARHERRRSKRFKCDIDISQEFMIGREKGVVVILSRC